MEAGVITAHTEIASVAASESRASAVACRVLDVAVSGLLLVLLAPLFALIALAVAADSPGRAIFRQRRVGRAGRPFTVNKFRTMHSAASQQQHKDYVLQLIATDAADKDSELFKLSADARVTRVGRVLRKSSLDELPQLWNVLLGDMPSWYARFAVRPGMTGLWQISGRSKLTYEQMVQLDIEYAHTRSLWLNVKILLRTIPAVLSARGAA